MIRLARRGLLVVAPLLLVSVPVTMAATERKASQTPTVSPEMMIGAVAGLLFVIICVVALVRRHRAAARREHLLELSEEADAFIAEARRGLEPIRTHLILKDGEHAVLEEASALMETRAYRVYGGGGTRIGGVYVGGGVSESRQRFKLIDEGTLTLTTKRLIFDGTQENRTVQLSQVVSVNPWADAIEVSTERRMKSQVYRVENPFIWHAFIEALAAGKFSTRVKNDQT